MGNFYTNYTLRGPSQQSVASALAGRSALVTPERDGCVVVFDEQSEDQDMEVIAELASYLSGELHCPVLAVLNHDDDLLWYRLYLNGELADEYDSTPGYLDFDKSDEPDEEGEATSGPKGGDAQKLCQTFGVDAVAEVESILRRSSFDEDGYTFAFERHADLAGALGIPSIAVAGGFEHVSNGSWPEGLEEAECVRVQDWDDAQPASGGAQNAIPGYYGVVLPPEDAANPRKRSLPMAWLPTLWTHLECPEDHLSDAFRRATQEYREQFKRLGFAEVGFKQARDILNPNHRDNGSVNYLDSTRRCFGQLIYNRVHLSARNVEKESVVVSFTAAFEGGALSITNRIDNPLGSPPDHEVVRIQTNDVALIYQTLVERLRQVTEAPRRFELPHSLPAWFDSHAVELFEHWVRQGRIVRLTPFEVAMARRRTPHFSR